MKLECLRAIASYHERNPYNEWKCTLALSAASPRARVAVELNQNFKCGVFRISVDESRTTRRVGIHLYELYEGRVCEDEEAMMDWWLLRRETCLPIMFKAYRPDISVWSPEAVYCCIEVSAMLPIVETMKMYASASSLSWVDKCTRLESLYAPKCLCPIRFSGFCNSACLKHLDVSWSKVKSFEGISGCVNLEVLDVSNCTGTGDYSPIGRCSRLKELTINNCYAITDFSWIGQLKALTRLSMDDLKLGDIGWIASCASLETLSMTRGRCEDHPINFSGFRNLVCLRSVYVNRSDVHSFEGISVCVNLEVLNVSYCTGTDDYSPIGDCSYLQRLFIDGCKTIRDFGWIAQLKALTWLSVGYLKLGDIGWIAGCTSLQRLFMARSSCEEYHPITTLKTLRWLEFYGTDASDMQWTKDMDSLQTVNVWPASNVESLISVMRSRYPDAKTWRDVLQACGALKRARDNSGSNNSSEASGALQAEQQR